MPVSAMKNCPSNRNPGGANLGGKVSFGPAFSNLRGFTTNQSAVRLLAAGGDAADHVGGLGRVLH